MKRAGKYSDYSIAIGEDYPRDCYYDEDVLGRGLIRLHYRVTRLPSKKQITLRHFHDATPADRVSAEQKFPRLRTTFEWWEDRTDAVHRARYVSNRRCSIFVVMAGSRVHDPLVQLELEMMIDKGKGEWLSEAQTAETLGVTVRDLANMRAARVGPAYYKPSLREVVYSRAEVNAFNEGLR